VKYTQSFILPLFCVHAPYQFKPFPNLSSLIFDLTPCVLLSQPLISDVNDFLFMPNFSGKQLGRKTRAWCTNEKYAPAPPWTPQIPNGCSECEKGRREFGDQTAGAMARHLLLTRVILLNERAQQKESKTKW